MAKNILCRICWNTNQWVRPSRDAAQLEGGGSYAAAHGFDHEEWLFNFVWRDESGYKYAFLQPISKNLSAYEGKDCEIALYTKDPSEWYFVAVINNCHVLTHEERVCAYRLHEQNGWLDEMKEHLEELNCNRRMFEEEQELIFNIRFKKDDVVFFDPFVRVPDDHKVRKFHRYQTLRGEISSQGIAIQPTARRRRKGSSRLKNTRTRTRSGTKSTKFDPLHDIIQNELHLYLKRTYGENAVVSEEDNVDLKLNNNGKLTFFEVKGYHTPKRCIREALGQLMEYAYWPPPESVDKLVIVGESKLDKTACEYLESIRISRRLPVYYASFNLTNKTLSEYY